MDLTPEEIGRLTALVDNLLRENADLRRQVVELRDAVKALLAPDREPVKT